MARPNTSTKPKSKYAGLNEAKANQGGLYMLPGIYKVKVLRVTDLTSRKKDDLFIVEMEILESDNKDRRAGMKPSWVVNLSQDAAMGNIKSFLAAAMDEDPNDADVDWEEGVETAVSDDQPLAGIELNLECVNIKTKAGGDFTLHKWSSVEAA